MRVVERLGLKALSENALRPTRSTNIRIGNGGPSLPRGRRGYCEAFLT
jgi:hypothetical protein